MFATTLGDANEGTSIQIVQDGSRDAMSIVTSAPLVGCMG